ncbi:hypothetical protein [Nostoc sp. 'Peltigera membranacea cyanobiont' 232]|uniref:hypothetical protein n=1 Tax=Nostoc sp. 'Peltigera membranacea cyanobiont' 232 TaxID=2014531 RepID=UPI000B95ABBF|nr:hypothetical protein [Nostoc sp. 'Peltigera membranacea cyanobiont' 232]OYE03026.1 hypothetical protein CDG79_20530 [Nostoc sp. 'Peltigera membranacea cyanobiont' 232]
MTRDEAQELISLEKPCFYTGKFKYLRNQRWYIKEVTQQGAIVNSTPGKLDYNESHVLGLRHLITEEEWKSHQGRDAYGGKLRK